MRLETLGQLPHTKNCQKIVTLGVLKIRSSSMLPQLELEGILKTHFFIH